jgi:hypothetical protein
MLHLKPRSMRGAPLGVLIVLLCASLACNMVQRWLIPGTPTAAVTVAVATQTPRPTRTPAPSATPGPSPTAAPTLPAAWGDLEQFRAAMRPEYAADVEQFGKATRYIIDVTVTFDGTQSATLTGSERIRYTNQQDFALNEIYLMLWPNGGEQYLSRMTMSNVTVAGQAVTPEMENGQLAARLPLAAPLASGASIDLSADFSIEAQDGIDTSGAARFGLTNGVLLAPTFYPLIPRIVEGGQWQTIPAPPGGDTTNSDTALYVWRVTAPADLAIAATGTVVDSAKSGGMQTQTIVTGPMRDLALVVGPLELTQRAVGDITLNAWMLAEHASLAAAMLDYTEGQITTLQAEVGDYPFEELDIVDAPGAFGGIEYPGTIFIGVVGQGDFFERATVHETGHQWFYSVVGDDQLLQPWLDEAAASYTEVLYEEKIHGARAAAAALREFRAYVPFAQHPDQPIGEPVANYASQEDYALIVYYKGALFFEALRQQMGDDVFFAFLKDYYAQYRYGFASSADFQAQAQKTCSCDLSTLFDLWVYKGGPIGP